MGMERLKARWGVQTTRELVIVFLVFSLAGTSILFVKQPLYQLLRVPDDASLWIKIPLVLCMYQVLLLAWGTALGQFRYFWEKEKKLGRLLTRPFLPRNPRESV